MAGSSVAVEVAAAIDGDAAPATLAAGVEADADGLDAGTLDADGAADAQAASIPPPRSTSTTRNLR
jgi:hypothetical protein